MGPGPGLFKGAGAAGNAKSSGRGRPGKAGVGLSGQALRSESLGDAIPLAPADAISFRISRKSTGAAARGARRSPEGETVVFLAPDRTRPVGRLGPVLPRSCPKDWRGSLTFMEIR